MSNKLKPAKRIFLDFYPSEAALVAHVEKQPRKQTYIKDLIRKDIALADDPFVGALAALRALDVFGSTSRISLHQVFSDRVAVEVDGEYFGIWATTRKTFVD
jgi:hypothetical protein